MLQVTPVQEYLFSYKMAQLDGVSTDSRDITHGMLKSIDEHAVVMQNFNFMLRQRSNIAYGHGTSKQ